MTTIKSQPWGISPCKIVDEKIILDECCFDETKHPHFNNNTEDVDKFCVLDAIGLDVEFVYSIECNSCKDRGPHIEVGVGKLVKENGKLTLDRSEVLYIQNPQLGRLKYEQDDLNPSYFDNNSPLVVSVHVSSPLDNFFNDTLYYDGGFVKLTEEGISRCNPITYNIYLVYNLLFCHSFRGFHFIPPILESSTPFRRILRVYF